MVYFDSSMISYFDSLLGFSYTDNPVLYLIGVMFIMWFFYQLFGLIYRILGVNYLTTSVITVFVVSDVD